MARVLTKKVAKRVWGGFYCGRLHYEVTERGTIVPALFFTKKGAREHYEDVRPIFLSDYTDPLTHLAAQA